MKENLMPHNAHPTRRTILTGAAWALPIIAASAAVPAYAANGAQTGTSHTIKGQANGRKTVKTFTVPAGVRELSFTLTGGAGGTVMARSQGGCGAKVTGTVSVTPGATVEIVAAAGGIGVLERVTRNGASWNESKPATGGEGCGKGGSSAAQVTVPAGPKAYYRRGKPPHLRQPHRWRRRTPHPLQAQHLRRIRWRLLRTAGQRHRGCYRSRWWRWTRA